MLHALEELIRRVVVFVRLRSLQDNVGYFSHIRLGTVEVRTSRKCRPTFKDRTQPNARQKTPKRIPDARRVCLQRNRHLLDRQGKYSTSRFRAHVV